MRSARRLVPPVVFACLLLAGCKSTSLGTSTPSGSGSPGAGAPGKAGPAPAIATGAGPQRNYTVQHPPAAASCH
ncbi:hypothetical protein ACFWIJ_40155 [Streptomyces sp. NPDC127079]|uniref:hypothetical protein n=1 Tax=Streptomyces sp. NPDC127079 TaxID=3347132 RepID=UPI003646EF7B